MGIDVAAEVPTVLTAQAVQADRPIRDEIKRRVLALLDSLGVAAVAD